MNQEIPLTADMICPIPEGVEIMSKLALGNTIIEILQRPADTKLKNGNYYARMENKGFGDFVTISFYLQHDCDYVYVSKQLFIFFCHYIALDREERGLQIH